jgi:hypothetical protein
MVSQIIDESVTKSNSKYPKVDAYTIFKKEFEQFKGSKNEDKSENEIQNAWSNLSKEYKGLYNIHAIKENDLLRKYFNNLKSYKKDDKKKKKEE